MRMPWVAEIHQQCLALSKSILPKSTLGQAVAYTLNHVAEAAAVL